MVKLNAFAKPVATNIETLLQKYKNVFAWNYINLKRIPPRIVQHYIELDITIPPVHQARYQMNPNYTIVVKYDLNKLLNASFISPMEEANWLSPIVIVPKELTSSKYVWISNNLMLLIRRIHIFYLLLKRCWTKWRGMRSIVAPLLWPSVGVKPNTWKSRELESSGTPECLELNSKGQNTSH
jgi:hypothetical protein